MFVYTVGFKSLRLHWESGIFFYFLIYNLKVLRAEQKTILLPLKQKREINKYKEIYSFRNISFSIELLICSVKIACKKINKNTPMYDLHFIDM